MQQPPNQEYPQTDVLDNIPFAERRVIHALVVFWQYTRYSHLNQVRPSPRILELIDRCRIGIDFFRQVYRDLCSDRRIKYVGFSESEFKQFLEIEYNQPFVEHQAQARTNQEQARADFDALGEEMAKTTDRKERIELGQRREVLAPFTGRIFVYQNHCWRCQRRISSAIHAQCPSCTYYICSSCGNCLCGYSGYHGEKNDPFLPDYPDDLS